MKSALALLAAIAAASAAAPANAQSGSDSSSGAHSDRYGWVYQVFADAAYQNAALKPAAKQALTDEAFVALQEGLHSSTAAVLSQLAARLAAGSDELAKTVRERQDLEQAWREADEATLAALVEGDAEAAQAARREGQDLAARIELADQLIVRSFPEYASIIESKPLSPEEVSRLLAPGEALIALFVGAEATHIFVVTPSGRNWHRAAVRGEEIGRLVRLTRCSLDTKACRNAPPQDPDTGFVPFDRAAARRLHNLLIEPVEASLEGARELVVVASGALASLPLALLVSDGASVEEGPTADEEALRGTAWLIDRYALSYVPSVAALHALRTLPAGAAGTEPFLGYGDPDLSPDMDTENERGARGLSQAFRGGEGGTIADPAAVRDSFSNLPETRLELVRIGDALGARPGAVRLGGEAREGKLKADPLHDVRVLAFATHGILAGEFAGAAEPALILTPPDRPSAIDDGVLTASEIARLTIGAEWVILSACNTAAPDGRPGAEGLSGLARAFFYAGARSLLVSHWPVLDDAAAQLTVATVNAERHTGVSRAMALREAMRSLRDDRSQSRAHPAAWAPFALVGGERSGGANRLAPPASPDTARPRIP